jgi:hypothetical protein
MLSAGGPSVQSLTVFDTARNVLVLGPFRSGSAMLTYEMGLPGPTLDPLPSTGQATVGQPFSINAVASGSAPFAYQWMKDGQSLTDDGRISGATTDTLSISPVEAGDAGSYTVAVQDRCGESLSTALQLDAAAPPPPGVCCRGATCNAQVAQDQCATTGVHAGASFASGAVACNEVGNAASPCCYADYNKSGNLEVADIFDFLNDWFAGSLYAIPGGDGVGGELAVANIFEFLNDWFAGCF